MVISGEIWLAIILAVFLVLFVIAKFMEKSNKKQSFPKNSAIQNLCKKLNHKLPQYNFSLKHNHITVIYQSKKIAMITLDKSKQTSKRKLGNVLVLNFRSLPSHKAVLAELPV